MIVSGPLLAEPLLGEGIVEIQVNSANRAVAVGVVDSLVAPFLSQIMWDRNARKGIALARF